MRARWGIPLAPKVRAFYSSPKITYTVLEIPLCGLNPTLGLVIRPRLRGPNNFAQSFTVQLSTKQVSEISSILLNVPLNSTKQQQNNQVAVKGHTTAGINILILIGTRD